MTLGKQVAMLFINAIHATIRIRCVARNIVRFVPEPGHDRFTGKITRVTFLSRCNYLAAVYYSVGRCPIVAAKQFTDYRGGTRS